MSIERKLKQIKSYANMQQSDVWDSDEPKLIIDIDYESDSHVIPPRNRRQASKEDDKSTWQLMRMRTSSSSLPPSTTLPSALRNSKQPTEDSSNVKIHPLTPLTPPPRVTRSSRTSSSSNSVTRKAKDASECILRNSKQSSSQLTRPNDAAAQLMGKTELVR